MGEFHAFEMSGGGFDGFPVVILLLSVMWAWCTGGQRNIRMNAVIVCATRLYPRPPLGEAGRSTTLTGPTENTT